MNEATLKNFHDGVEKIFRDMEFRGYKFTVDGTELKRTTDVDAVLLAIWEKPYATIECHKAGMKRITLYRDDGYIEVHTLLEGHALDALLDEDLERADSYGMMNKYVPVEDDYPC